MTGCENVKGKVSVGSMWPLGSVAHVKQGPGVTVQAREAWSLRGQPLQHRLPRSHPQRTGRPRPREQLPVSQRAVCPHPDCR